MNVFIYAEASAIIGAGHVMRCLTLSDGLAAKGANVFFICASDDGNLNSYIGQRGYEVFSLPRNIGIERKAELIMETLQLFPVTPDWFVIDHYGADVSFESMLRAYVGRIMVIDDLADREHCCDLLLDQNRLPHNDVYGGLVPHACVKLMGPQYALLRPQFAEARARYAEDNGTVRRILVFMGGTDPMGLTCFVLAALQSVSLHNIAVDVVTGSGNPYRDGIEKLISAMPDTRFYYDVENMAELMSAADLSIGSAGSASWERCCIGLPSVVITAAENQKIVAEMLDRTGAALTLGWYERVTKEDIASTVTKLIADNDKRIAMTLKGMELVDGMGADRVVRKMLDICGEVA